MIRRKTRADGSIAYLVRVGDSPSRTFTRWDDAIEYEATLRRSRTRSKVGLEEVKPNLTFADLVALWEGNFAPSPWRKSMIRHTTDRWGTVRVRDIQPEQFGAWVNSIRRSEKTRAHILETARQVFNAGVEWGYLARSPARRGVFKVPSKRARLTPIQPFESWAEVEAVAEQCRYGTAPQLVRFACATGLRVPGEVMSLLWSDVDLKNKNVITGSKTAAGHRTVPLSIHALSALGEIPRRIDNGPVFTGRNGNAFDYPGWRRGDWRRALALAGLKHRPPYEMRHTFATLALAQGAGINDVATVMGHEEITVVYDYYRKWIKVAADRLRDTLDQIGASDGTEGLRTLERGG